jgi:O-antigen/teichoic acid export membrane protein
MMQLTAGNYRGKKIYYISQGIEVSYKSLIPLIFLLYCYLSDIEINVNSYFLLLVISGSVYLLTFHRDLFGNLSNGFYGLSHGFLKTKQFLTKNLKETTALTATISVANSMRLIDIAMLGLLSTFIETANYKVCVSFALLASVLFSAIGQFIMPYLGTGRDKNTKFIQNITRLSFLLTILSCCFLYLIAPFILKNFFKIDFEEVRTLLTILLFSNIVISFWGYTFEFCVMNDLGTKMFKPALLIILLNVFLNFILISSFQAIGAALSTTICSVLFAVITWYVIRHTFKTNMSVV